jgi:polar amino acid transport system substrate-binding protein
MRTRAFATFLASAAATLAVAACGSSPASSGSGSSGTPINSALHAQLPPSIRSSGTMTMATDGTIGYPWALITTSGKIYGLDVDLANALSQELGVTINAKQVAFENLIPGIESGRYNFSMSAQNDTKARQAHVSFVDFINDGSGFLVQTSSTLKHLTLSNDLCGLTVGVLAGSVEQLDIQKQATTCASAGKPKLAENAYPTNTAAILALESGRVQVFDGDGLQNAYISKQPGSKITQSGLPYGVAPVGLLVAKGSPLLRIFQKALQDLINSGKYAQILAKYGAQIGAEKVATVNHAIF